MYQILVQDDDKNRSFFYTQHFNEHEISIIEMLGFEIVKVDFIDDPQYDGLLSECLNYPEIMN